MFRGGEVRWACGFDRLSEERFWSFGCHCCLFTAVCLFNYLPINKLCKLNIQLKLCPLTWVTWAKVISHWYQCTCTGFLYWPPEVFRYEYIVESSFWQIKASALAPQAVFAFLFILVGLFWQWNISFCSMNQFIGLFW